MWFLPSRCWQSFWDDVIRNLKQNMEKYCDFHCSSFVIFRGRIWKEHAYTLSLSGLSPIYAWLRNTLHLLCYCDLLEYEMQSKAVIWSHMQGDQPPASLMQAMWYLPQQGIYWNDDWAPGGETWLFRRAFSLEGHYVSKVDPGPISSLHL